MGSILPMLLLIQVAAAEEGSESYTQAKEAATTAEEEAATCLESETLRRQLFRVIWPTLRLAECQSRRGAQATAAKSLEESLAEFKVPSCCQAAQATVAVEPLNKNRLQ